MAFANSDTSAAFKTGPRRFTPGYGIIIRLLTELPTRYNEQVLGPPTQKGLVLEGVVEEVLGARHAAPSIGSTISVRLRANDLRQAIYDDLERTKEGFSFLLEGITGPIDALQARWAHGAGANRQITFLEIVGTPHVSFENPIPKDGPKSGWLHLNLDGSPTAYDVRGADGTYTSHELAFDDVTKRLGEAVSTGRKFKVSQRVLVPSASALVANQHDLEHALTTFRNAGYTSCAVRTYIPNTTLVSEVDVQVLNWPADIPPDDNFAGSTYTMPTLQETPRFVALRDGEALAQMEVIPGYVLVLVGNPDVSKSTKHRFVQEVVKGLSDARKSFYATQTYGPGIALCAVGEDRLVAGMVRIALRTEGTQYRNLLTIPTHHFPTADRVKVAAARASTDAET